MVTPFELQLRYAPKGAARDLFISHAPEILIEGPAGTGKSRAVLEKIYALVGKYPNSRHLILRKFRASMTETVLVTWEKIVLGGRHYVLNGAHRSHRQSYVFANGAEVICGGLDNAERIMSAEYDTVNLFEGTEADEEEWEQVLTRLRNNVMPYQQGIVDCNPGPPGHWLNMRGDRSMHRLRSRHDDNPSIKPQYLTLLAELTGVRRARYFLGKWVGSEGLIFDTFGLPDHVRPCADKIGRVVVGVDYGVRNPFAALRGVLDGDGVLWITAEQYGKELTEQPMIAAIKSVARGHERVVIDPSAAGLKLAATGAGLSVKDADNSVLWGIDVARQRFADGRCFVDPTCVNLIRELQGYEWADNDKKDVPVKENDHACDALRYLTAYLDTGYTFAMAVAGGDPPERKSKWDDWP